MLDRDGRAFKVTEARWQKLPPAAQALRGLGGALRAEHGHDLVSFLEESALLDEQVADRRCRGRAARPRGGTRASTYATELRRAGRRAICGSARSSAAPGLAHTHRCAATCSSARVPQLREGPRATLVELAGTPPFDVRLGDRAEQAPSFEALRAACSRVAQKGVALKRFKGLGEMNAEQLRETTMDPATRTLQQVTMEDADRRRPDLLDADGRRGRAAPRLHRGQRARRRQPRRLIAEKRTRAMASADVLQRPLRAARARGRDEDGVPRLRHVRHRRSRAARRPRRPQAGAPPRALRRCPSSASARRAATRSAPASSAR